MSKAEATQLDPEALERRLLKAVNTLLMTEDEDFIKGDIEEALQEGRITSQEIADLFKEKLEDMACIN